MSGKAGGLSGLMKLMPGMAQVPAEAMTQLDDSRKFVRFEAAIGSMTVKERMDPKLIDGQRRARIARGSGTSVAEVNELL